MRGRRGKGEERRMSDEVVGGHGGGVRGNRVMLRPDWAEAPWCLALCERVVPLSQQGVRRAAQVENKCGGRGGSGAREEGVKKSPVDRTTRQIPNDFVCVTTFFVCFVHIVGPPPLPPSPSPPACLALPAPIPEASSHDHLIDIAFAPSAPSVHHHHPFVLQELLCSPGMCSRMPAICVLCLAAACDFIPLLRHLMPLVPCWFFVKLSCCMGTGVKEPISVWTRFTRRSRGRSDFLVFVCRRARASKRSSPAMSDMFELGAHPRATGLTLPPLPLFLPLPLLQRGSLPDACHGHPPRALLRGSALPLHARHRRCLPAATRHPPPSRCPPRCR